MATTDSQAELDTTNTHCPSEEQVSATATALVGKHATSDHPETNANVRVSCPHCTKSYSTKKSLTRHLNSTGCASKEPTKVEAPSAEPQQKPKWACSRCGKHCTTLGSVERHITNSCWRTCDECAANGDSYCDSHGKTGACRTCAAKGRPCTKHTSAVSGSVAQRVEPVAQPHTESSIHEGATDTAKPKAVKRKTPSSPVPSPGEKHRNKRRAPTMQQLFEEDVGRKYDPLGQDAYVPATVKKEAVSHWLHDQQRNQAVSGGQFRDPVQIYPTVPSQPISTFTSQTSQHPYQYVDPSRTIRRAVPPSTYVQQARLGYNRPTTGHEMNMQYAPQPWNQQGGGYQMTPSSAFSNMPDLASYSDRMASAEEASRHLEYLYHKMKATRKEAQARNAAMDEQYRVRHGKAPPQPFGMSGALSQTQGFNMARAPGRHMDIATPQSLAALNLTPPPDSIMTLRIHSNTFDINGQPIFSLLRMRRNEKFGPRLNAYCVNRGKEFGEEWMFVYRYLAAIPTNPQQHLQITLSWDMTPQDVKDEDFPGMSINHLDTIYVMVAKPLPTAFTFDLTGENEGVRSPGPQIPRNSVDIVPGETKLYQNDNIARQWYLAVEHDAARMRGMHGALKSTILRQKQQIEQKDETIKKLQDSLSQVTTLSSQLRGRMQDPRAAEPAVVPGDRIIRQRVEYPRSRPRVNLPQQRNPSTFVTKCEAVRDPEAQTLQSLTPLQFPTYATQQALSDAERRAQFDAFVREGERDIAEAEAEAEMIEDTIADTVEDTIADTEEEEESDDIKMEEEE